VKVEVAIAEASPSLTLSLHVVQNHPRAAAAGHGNILVPGYTLLTSCEVDDDLATCRFDLPEKVTCSEQPVFIIPSTAKGDRGAFTITVDASGPVEVCEVPEEERNLCEHKWSTEVRWSAGRPYSRYQGGKRVAQSAPALSWYRNPQFRVRLKDEHHEPHGAEDQGTGTIADEWGFAKDEPEQESDSAAICESTATMTDTSEKTMPLKKTKKKGTLGAAKLRQVLAQQKIERENLEADKAKHLGNIVELEVDIQEQLQAEKLKLMADMDTEIDEAADHNENLQTSGKRGSVVDIDGLCEERCRLESQTLELHLLDDVHATKQHKKSVFETQMESLENHKIQYEKKQRRVEAEINKAKEVNLADLEPDQRSAAVKKVKQMMAEKTKIVKELKSTKASLVKLKKGIEDMKTRTKEIVEKKSKLELISTKIHNLKHAVEKIDEKLQDFPEFTEADEDASKAAMPLLQAFLVPLDERQQVPVALHVVQNLTKKVDGVEENVSLHTVLASSGIPGAEYQVASEIGSACVLPLPHPPQIAQASRPSSAPVVIGNAEEGTGGDCLFVVPSLEAKDLEGAFMLHLVATDPIDVEQVH
jgi:hypothetical protein